MKGRGEIILVMDRKGLDARTHLIHLIRQSAYLHLALPLNIFLLSYFETS